MLLSKIKEGKIVAVIRGALPEQIVLIAEALSKGGITSLEITVESPRAIYAIEKLSMTFGDKLIIGAGTVLDSETARAAILAGAKFIFSPNVDEKTIQLTKRYGIISIPGALTPTEIIKAFESGGDIVKVFPASVLGPKYLRDIKGPLPHIPLMPTGGINTENINHYLSAGAVAVGVGGSLVNIPKGETNAAYLESLTSKATQFVNIVNRGRERVS